METREVFWNIAHSSQVIFYILSGLALSIFGYGIYINVKRILQGKKESGFFGLSLTRSLKTLWTVFSNSSILKGDGLAGLMHLFIMWGMIILFLGTVTITIDYDILRPISENLRFWRGAFFLWYELILDSLGLLLIVGLVLALVRRYTFGLAHLSHNPLDLIFPLLLLIIALTGFLVEGLRIAVTDPPWKIWSPVGSSVGEAFKAFGLAAKKMKSLHFALWWTHAVLVLAGIAYVPYAPKVLHMLSAAFNVYGQNLGPRGQLKRLDVEGAFERKETLGIQTLKDLTRKDFLDLYSCTECGRCEANCPANLSGKILSPKDIVIELRDHSYQELPALAHSAEKQDQDIVSAAVEPEELWACTTCAACVEVCPVKIDPLNKIMELRRAEVMMKDKYPEGFVGIFAGLEKRANPWNLPATSRADWAKDLNVKTLVEDKDVELLFFIGCASAYEPRNQKIAKSVVHILKGAGINFGILGEEESCTGDPARRIGNEYLFQILARQNIEVFNSYGVKKILTICPHCYNTIKNEYPQFLGNYEVLHHTQLIAQLIQEGRIKLEKGLEVTVAYHDSCYLGRHNSIYNPPRHILRAIPGVELVELFLKKERGMCCGAGGGLMWLEEEKNKRVNELRIAQALFTRPQAQIIATACPFCMTMLEDGIKAKDVALEDKDIAELVVEAMKGVNDE